jgi:hypothetical protein
LGETAHFRFCFASLSSPRSDYRGLVVGFRFTAFFLTAFFFFAVFLTAGFATSIALH